MEDKSVTWTPPMPEGFRESPPPRPTAKDRWMQRLATIISADKMQVNHQEGQRQGYATPAYAARAARRAARAALHAAKNGGSRPPSHLQRKIALLVPIVNPKGDKT